MVIEWKDYLIMQFLNTITFLIVQEFFWLKARKRMDKILRLEHLHTFKRTIKKHLKR